MDGRQRGEQRRGRGRARHVRLLARRGGRGDLRLRGHQLPRRTGVRGAGKPLLPFLKCGILNSLQYLK